MSKIKLNAIAAQALLDDEFKAAILSGKHQDRLHDFELNEEEVQAVMSINALSVDEFIRRLGNLMQPAPALSSAV